MRKLKFKDLTNFKFGRLIVLKRNNKECRRIYWDCICKCGKKVVICGEKLKNGRTKSCGCLRLEKLRKRRFWTFTKIKEKAIKCKTRTEFHTRFGSAFAAAIKLNILDKVCSHMAILCTKRTDKELEILASKFKNKKEFRKRHRNAYFKALRRGILDNICKHMEILGSHYKRALYAFEYPDKSVYVGLTYNYELRYRQHMTNNKLLIKKYKKGGQTFKKFNIWYSKDIVGHKEAELIEKYRKNGWTILNKAKAGNLGSLSPRKTKNAKNNRTRKSISSRHVI